jgi:exonuclease VII small subunit
VFIDLVRPVSVDKRSEAEAVEAVYELVNCFSSGMTSKRPLFVTSATMEVVTEYADQRTELEEKIRSLEADKASLLAGIASLKGKIATYELERAATQLESEVEALRTEKAVLDEKAAAYEAEAGYDLPPGTGEGV